MDAAEEFAELERAVETWVKVTKPDPSRIEDLWDLYYKKEDPYRTVLNGHLVMEDLLNQILRESFRQPDGLLDFSFANKLALLKALSPTPHLSANLVMVDKLNRLRNAVVHADLSKREKVLEEIARYSRKNYTLPESLKDLKELGTLIAFAFGTAFARLEDILEHIRLENKVQKLTTKPGPKDPVGVQAFHLLGFFEFLRSKTKGSEQSSNT